MKTNPKHPLVVAALIVGVGIILAGRVAAQTFTTLYTFMSTTPSLPWINSDGSSPTAPLLLSSNLLYGTTAVGGSAGCGVVFAIKPEPDGTGFTNLYTFVYSDTLEQVYPKAGLLLANNLFYGTDAYGGLGAGSVFSLRRSGTGFTFLHQFPRLNYQSPYTNTDGAVPSGALLLAGDTFYGTAAYGGTQGLGTAYAVKTNGTGFRVLHHFTGGTSRDGSRPQATLILSASGQTLYGTTPGGGSPGQGTVFAVNTDGSGFRPVHGFSILDGDGCSPQCGLVLSASGNTLYGTTHSGGNQGSGTVFAVNPDGSGFTVLHRFTATTPPVNDYNNTNLCINSDGACPLEFGHSGGPELSERHSVLLGGGGSYHGLVGDRCLSGGKGRRVVNQLLAQHWSLDILEDQS